MPLPSPNPSPFPTVFDRIESLFASFPAGDVLMLPAGSFLGEGTEPISKTKVGSASCPRRSRPRLWGRKSQSSPYSSASPCQKRQKGPGDLRQEVKARPPCARRPRTAFEFPPGSRDSPASATRDHPCRCPPRRQRDRAGATQVGKVGQHAEGMMAEWRQGKAQAPQSAALRSGRPPPCIVCNVFFQSMVQ